LEKERTFPGRSSMQWVVCVWTQRVSPISRSIAFNLGVWD